MENCEYQTRNGATINDRRKNGDKPEMGYVVFTDSFMSGWGGAEGGRSLYALACETSEDVNIVWANGSRRSEMKRPRHIVDYRADGTPAVKLNPNDHISVADRSDAARWYVDGGF